MVGKEPNGVPSNIAGLLRWSFGPASTLTAAATKPPTPKQTHKSVSTQSFVAWFLSKIGVIFFSQYSQVFTNFKGWISYHVNIRYSLKLMNILYGSLSVHLVLSYVIMKNKQNISWVSKCHVRMNPLTFSLKPFCVALTGGLPIVWYMIKSRLYNKIWHQ